MPIFTAAFSAVAATTVAQDVFELVGSAQDRTRLRSVTLGQSSIVLSSQALSVAVQIIRGYDVAAAGGTAITPRIMDSYSSRAAGATVTRLSTTVASSSSATPHVLDAGVWHAEKQQYQWSPAMERDMPTLKISERAVVRISAPAAGITISGTLVFEELPQVPA